MAGKRPKPAPLRSTRVGVEFTRRSRLSRRACRRHRSAARVALWAFQCEVHQFARATHWMEDIEKNGEEEAMTKLHKAERERSTFKFGRMVLALCLALLAS